MRYAAMVKAAERAGTSAGIAVRWSESMGQLSTMNVATLIQATTASDGRSTVIHSSVHVAKPSAVIRVAAAMIEIVAINEGGTVRDVGVVFVDDPAIAPIVSPVVPAPAESAEVADAKAVAKKDPRSAEIESGKWIPAGIDHEGRSVYDPRIVFRYVNDFRIDRLNDDGGALTGNGLLRIRL